MIRRIKLMAEYGNTVLWGIDPADIGAIDPEHLPLTADLKAALRAWANAYDKTLNHEYPPDSGFASPADEEAFEAEGRRLWKRLQAQLGHEYEVRYHGSCGGNTETEEKEVVTEMRGAGRGENGQKTRGESWRNRSRSG
jgi:hypothetical protein